MNTATATMTQTWQTLCTRADLVPFSGIAAWLETAEGPAQVALFYLPGFDRELYALDHHDPIAGANVNARGIVGDLKGEAVVASPLYKHHYRLSDGQCLENPGLRLRTWAVTFQGDEVLIET
jgi:nitrite reductase (NADH) small subunit